MQRRQKSRAWSNVRCSVAACLIPTERENNFMHTLQLISLSAQAELLLDQMKPLYIQIMLLVQLLYINKIFFSLGTDGITKAIHFTYHRFSSHKKGKIFLPPPSLWWDSALENLNSSPLVDLYLAGTLLAVALLCSFLPEIFIRYCILAENINDIIVHNQKSHKKGIRSPISMKYFTFSSDRQLSLTPLREKSQSSRLSHPEVKATSPPPLSSLIFSLIFLSALEVFPLHFQSHILILFLCYRP